jgi:hypothetical protein
LDTINVTLTRPAAQGATGGVAQNENEAVAGWAPSPPALTPDQLKDARGLSLSANPISARATAVVTEIAAQVANYEATSGTRKTSRRQSGLDKQRQAVAAIVGGLLRHWGRREPHAVFRSRTPAAFTGGPVAARQYLSACDALVALGLIHQSRSIRYGLLWDDKGPEVFLGKAPRLWPTQSLLDIVGQHCLTPATLAEDFGDTYPTKPPVVPEPLQVFALKQKEGAEKRPIRIRHGNPEATRIREEVASYNEWVAQHDIRGCLPPRFKRVFTALRLLGGRWYAVGNEGNYQLLSETERVRITIDGEPIVEADVRASHLSIMHGLLGLPLPEGDPYEFPDVPRSVAKAWITATLGKGSPVKRWADRAAKDNPELLDFDPKRVGEVVCERYPFLRRPAQAVTDAAGLSGMTHIVWIGVQI